MSFNVGEKVWIIPQNSEGVVKDIYFPTGLGGQAIYLVETPFDGNRLLSESQLQPLKNEIKEEKKMGYGEIIDYVFEQLLKELESQSAVAKKNAYPARSKLSTSLHIRSATNGHQQRSNCVRLS